jgi:pyridoxal phosphate enzyme (YggS family)
MSLTDNFKAVRARIAAAAVRAGREPNEVRLVAVSKKVDAAAVQAAAGLGQHVFGENRVDELKRKIDACPDEEFHFIGSLQTNKVRQVVGKAALIHSVDSLHLLQKIDARAAFLGIEQPVLLQVNVSGEAVKHGFNPADMDALLQTDVPQLTNVLINGLMTMAPNQDAEAVRWVFSDLRELAGGLDTSGLARVDMRELSMGMSGDFEVAIEEGATLVRVGTALFSD